jgi:hypothetical protein
MNERRKVMVAKGAAAAANGHLCLEYHIAKCDELRIPREEVAETIRVGLMVNHGAERAIRKKPGELLGQSMAGAT